MYVPTRFALQTIFLTLAISLPCDRLPGEEKVSVEFVRDIHPIFEQHCVVCHGPVKQEASLRLDRGSGAHAGGDSGAVLDLLQPEQSLLLRRIRAADGLDRMPPDGPGLSAAELAKISAWIAGGATHPAESAVEIRSGADHWAFRPLTVIPPPDVRNADRTRNAIDHFVLARLEQVPVNQPIHPSAAAERSTLRRRMSLDLRGLPPQLEEIEDDSSDERPDSYERLADRWLASVSYGERWGRWWLDQARYADSNGYTRDFGREIWPYRDWVIRALNSDMPFDQFSIEQLAGDMLPEASLDQKIATGFHRNTLLNEEGGTDQEQFRVEAVADRVATTGSVWLGLTIGCARCHNHKYDPISQREFYQLFAFLNNCDEPSVDAPTPSNLRQGDLERRAEIRGQIAALNEQVELQRAELDVRQQEWEKTVTPEQRARLPGPVQAAYDMPFEKRDKTNKQLIEDYYRASELGRQTFPLLDQIAKLKEIEPKIPTTLVLQERTEPRETHLHKRGDFLNLGVKVTPATLAVLPASRNPSSPSASRLDLAQWLVDRENPLTPRVTANRVWLQFFGRGIVETDDDFGTQGTPPAHPELLDWLARDLLGSSTNTPWSMKRLVRSIVMSATYRQSSRRRAELDELDPRNDLLARQVRLRVDAELIRDLALETSGLLTRQVGGPSVMPPQPDGVYAFTQDPKPWNAETGANRYRRGMYTFFWRSLPYPMLSIFDAPNANVTCTRRIRSNTPLQSLTLANDLAFVECAQHTARRVLQEAAADAESRARYLFQISLARLPSAAELQRVLQLLDQQQTLWDREQLSHSPVNLESQGVSPPSVSLANRELADREFASWTAVSRVVLNLDEFITRE